GRGRRDLQRRLVSPAAGHRGHAGSQLDRTSGVPALVFRSRTGGGGPDRGRLPRITHRRLVSARRHDGAGVVLYIVSRRDGHSRRHRAGGRRRGPANDQVFGGLPHPRRRRHDGGRDGGGPGRRVVEQKRRRSIRHGDAADHLGFSADENFRPGHHLPRRHGRRRAHQRSAPGGGHGGHGADADALDGRRRHRRADVFRRYHRPGRHRQLGGAGAMKRKGWWQG